MRLTENEWNLIWVWQNFEKELKLFLLHLLFAIALIIPAPSLVTHKNPVCILMRTFIKQLSCHMQSVQEI